MKINYLKVNGFGKLNNKEIELSQNINLIYGENETGKTTFLKFISSMFFGSSKNKNGNEISDFDRYRPWSATDFSGKVKYVLDNGQEFEVFRDFTKKNPIIYNEKKEDISKQFNIDKTKGNEFFSEQTKIDEGLLYTTSVVEQQNVVLDDKSKNMLTQKISNLLSTGNDNISYKKSIDKLNKKLIEDVGTERTSDRPINNIITKITTIMKQKELLEEYNNRKEEIERHKVVLKEKLENKYINIELIKDIKKIKEDEILEKERISTKDNIKKEYSQKIDVLEKEVKKTNAEENFVHPNNKRSLVIILILLVLNIVINFINTYKVPKYILAIGTVAYFIITVILYAKSKSTYKRVNVKNDDRELRVKKELEIIIENKNNLEIEINKLDKELNDKLDFNYNAIKSKYNTVNMYEVNRLIDLELNSLKNSLEIEKNTHDDMKLELSTIELEEIEIENKLDKKAFYEEQIIELNEQKAELLGLEKSIILAKSVLENAYEKIKGQITPKFTKNLSVMVEKISSGKYTNVSFNDEYGLRVELDNGEYVDSGLLSLGTMDQLYLSLRLSTIQEVSKEKMPIILDESFVYYDQERLENILKHLNENCKDFQIIILSCSLREIETMNKLGISYNLIEL